MTLALALLIVVYAALKLASIARPELAGFRPADISWRERLYAREPTLFLSALMLSLPFTLLATRYAHRTLTDQYETAASCYGRLIAVKDDPAFSDRFEEFAVYERLEAQRQAAFAMAAALDVAPGEVRMALADKAQLFVDRHALMQSLGLRQEALVEIEKARRCLLPPGADRN